MTAKLYPELSLNSIIWYLSLYLEIALISTWFSIHKNQNKKVNNYYLKLVIMVFLKLNTECAELNITWKPRFPFHLFHKQSSIWWINSIRRYSSLKCVDRSDIGRIFPPAKTWPMVISLSGGVKAYVYTGESMEFSRINLLET